MSITISGNNSLNQPLQNQILINTKIDKRPIKLFEKCCLHKALQNNQNKLKFYDLIRNNAPIDEQDEDGRTPLVIAIANNNLKAVDLLIKKNCNLNLAGKDNVTALDLAVDFRNEKVVKALVKAGVKTDIIDDEGFTPRSRALALNYTELIKYLPDDINSKKIHFAKIAANFIGMRYSLRLDKTNENSRKIDLEGFFEEIVCHIFETTLNQINQSYNPLINKIYDPLITPQIANSFKNAQNIKVTDINLTMKRIKNNELVIIPTGWTGHIVTFVFYRNAMAICNCGSGAYKNSFNNFGFLRFYPRKNLTIQMLDSLIHKTVENDISSRMKYLYSELPNELACHQNAFTRKVEKTLNFKLQHWGNCPVKSNQIALLFGQILIKRHFSRSNIPTDNWFDEQLQMNRHFMTFAKISSLQQYIKNVPSFAQDEYFIEAAVDRIADHVSKHPDDPFNQPETISTIYRELQETKN
ncbi:MAG: ankyrin repeat domain-containing protein [Parachlamydiales bacterium]|nr:ankyrin repeat domain-containing protein [Parachlamydiales bacterium]